MLITLNRPYVAPFDSSKPHYLGHAMKFWNQVEMNPKHSLTSGARFIIGEKQDTPCPAGLWLKSPPSSMAPMPARCIKAESISQCCGSEDQKQRAKKLTLSSKMSTFRLVENTGKMQTGTSESISPAWE